MASPVMDYVQVSGDSLGRGVEISGRCITHEPIELSTNGPRVDGPFSAPLGMVNGEVYIPHYAAGLYVITGRPVWLEGVDATSRRNVHVVEVEWDTHVKRRLSCYEFTVAVACGDQEELEERTRNSIWRLI